MQKGSLAVPLPLHRSPSEGPPPWPGQAKLPLPHPAIQPVEKPQSRSSRAITLHLNYRGNKLPFCSMPRNCCEAFGNEHRRIRQNLWSRSIRYLKTAHSHSPSLKSYPTVSAKAYPNIDSRNVQFIIALGNMCSATTRLPTSAVLSAGLERRGNIPEDSGGTTDIWRGEYGGTQVAIKAFRIHPSQRRKEAKEVRIRSASKFRLQTTFTDPVETGAHLEEVVSRKHLAIPRCGHDALPACARLRLGTKWQYQPIHSVASRRIPTVSGTEGSSYCCDYSELLITFPRSAVVV